MHLPQLCLTLFNSGISQAEIVPAWTHSVNDRFHSFGLQQPCTHTQHFSRLHFYLHASFYVATLGFPCLTASISDASCGTTPVVEFGVGRVHNGFETRLSLKLSLADL